MPKAKAAIKSSQPKPAERPRESSADKEHFFAVKHINFKIYDEDAELFNKVSDLSAVGSLCTQIFRVYFANLDGIYHGKFPADLPEAISRPAFEYALIKVPTEVWKAYQVMAAKSQTQAKTPKHVSDDLMLKAIQVYSNKINPGYRKADRSRKSERKNNSARRWETHFKICFLNFRIYDQDALNANTLPNLNGFANLCTNGLRAYYFHLHNFYKHGLTLFVRTASTSETTFEYALIPLPPRLWDSYVEHARNHFAATGERISAETWMLRGIEDYIMQPTPE